MASEPPIPQVTIGTSSLDPARQRHVRVVIPPQSADFIECEIAEMLVDSFTVTAGKRAKTSRTEKTRLQIVPKIAGSLTMAECVFVLSREQQEAGILRVRLFKRNGEKVRSVGRAKEVPIPGPRQVEDRAGLKRAQGRAEPTGSGSMVRSGSKRTQTLPPHPTPDTDEASKPEIRAEVAADPFAAVPDSTDFNHRGDSMNDSQDRETTRTFLIRETRKSGWWRGFAVGVITSIVLGYAGYTGRNWYEYYSRQPSAVPEATTKTCFPYDPLGLGREDAPWNPKNAASLPKETRAWVGSLLVDCGDSHVWLAKKRCLADAPNWPLECLKRTSAAVKKAK